ncbi:hypothetical protein AKJ16_DCAP19626, partial [Drosera capensis]
FFPLPRHFIPQNTQTPPSHLQNSCGHPPPSLSHSLSGHHATASPSPLLPHPSLRLHPLRPHPNTTSHRNSSGRFATLRSRGWSRTPSSSPHVGASRSTATTSIFGAFESLLQSVLVGGCIQVAKHQM